MAASESSAPLAPKKENLTPIGSKIVELNESKILLLSRIQGLEKDLQNWRLKLDTQVKIYHDELSDLKKSLNVEIDQLRSEFQELRSTLQQQLEAVTASLKNLGLQDSSEDVKEVEDPKIGDKKDEETHTLAEDSDNKAEKKSEAERTKRVRSPPKPGSGAQINIDSGPVLLLRNEMVAAVDPSVDLNNDNGKKIALNVEGS